MTDQNSGPIGHELVLEALQRILNVEQFRNADRLSAFLSYVVTETLGGRGHKIKAYSIGLEVFGKPATFDGSVDPIVRTTAARLRAAMERYYRMEGSADPVEIVLSKGSYIPEFHRRGAVSKDLKFGVHPNADAAEAPNSIRPPAPIWRNFIPRAVAGLLLLLLLALSTTLLLLKGAGSAGGGGVTTIVVEPVRSVGDNALVNRLTNAMNERLVPKLVEYGGVDIIDATREKSLDSFVARQVERAAPEDVLFSLIATASPSNDHVSIVWRLVDLRSRKVAWASEFRLGNSDAGNTDGAINGIVNSLLGTDGAISILLNRQGEVTGDARRCLSASQRLTLFYDAQMQALSQACLEELVKAEPKNGQAWALLSLSSYWASRTAPTLGADPSDLDAQQKVATAHALALAPTSYLTLQAVMFQAYSDGQFERFDQTWKLLLQRFGGDPYLKIRIAHVVGAIGRLGEALPLARQGIEDAGASSDIGYLMFVYDCYVAGRYREALSWLNFVGPRGYYMVPLIRTAIEGRLGNKEAAQAAWSELLKMKPNYNRYYFADFRHKRVSAVYTRMIADGIQSAGIVLDAAPGGM